ncbi:dipeptide ABC transporter ATP-binding protein [Luteipulveratus mongoliensis]|uniref:dipeptide ABC transporter ATP-binding protein n=1 Tax=Luteipulveratus mongoliensis TaxID=571913 RepID=UPI0009FA7284|nr:ABC transporter ATP-binding protein [Luteipulveratus mongoliensis]
MSTPVLTVRGLRIAFPDGRQTQREVVHGVDLTLRPGQVLGLVGESGSGKSVMAMSILRLLEPDTSVEGSIQLDGLELLTADAETIRGIRGRQIGAVFQEPMAAWNPVFTIGDQIAEALAAHGDSVPAGRVEELLAEAGIDDPERIAASYPHQLSGGQLQRAMIAMGMSKDPAVLIADEPTTALDVTVQAGVLDLLRSLRDRGTAILLITHDMGVIADLADHVIVLRDGTVVESGSVDDVLGDPQETYTRSLLAAVPRLDGSSRPVEAEANSEAAAVRDLTVRYDSQRRRGQDLVAVDGVDLTLYAGRTLGLVGESGSGKSTIGRALAGLTPATSGDVEIGGESVTRASRRGLRAIQRDVGIVFQDPASSLNPKHPVGRSIAEPLRLASWSRQAIEERVAELLTSVRLDPALAERYPHQLSGGQRQRVAIARALALRPRLLIADEPTSALDVSVQATVLDLLVALQDEQGFAALLISHDLAVVQAVAHDVAVLRHGQIVEKGPTSEVLTDPTEDYTRRLLAAAPVPDPVVQRRRREERATLLT